MYVLGFKVHIWERIQQDLNQTVGMINLDIESQIHNIRNIIPSLVKTLPPHGTRTDIFSQRDLTFRHSVNRNLVVKSSSTYQTTPGYKCQLSLNPIHFLCWYHMQNVSPHTHIFCEKKRYDKLQKHMISDGFHPKISTFLSFSSMQ